MSSSRDILRRILAGGKSNSSSEDSDYPSPYNTPLGRTVERYDDTYEERRKRIKRYIRPESGLYYWPRCRRHSSNPAARPDLWEVDTSWQPQETSNGKRMRIILERRQEYDVPIETPYYNKKDLLEIQPNWEDPVYYEGIPWINYGDPSTSTLAPGKSHLQHCIQSRLSWRNYYRIDSDQYGFHYGNKDIINERQYEVVCKYRQEYLSDEYLPFPHVNAEFVEHTLKILSECSITADEVAFVGPAIFCNRLASIKLGFASGKFDVFPKDDRDPMDWILPENYYKWDKRVKHLFQFSV